MLLESIRGLVSSSLKDAVTVQIDTPMDVPRTLIQEFVKLKQDHVSRMVILTDESVR